jgi:hypothetical protein
MADYNVRIGDQVTVQIHGDLLQAVNNPPLVNSSTGFGSLPIFTLHLEGYNAKNVSDALNAALKEKNPSVSATQVLLDSNSNGTNLHYDLNFNVVSVSTARGDVSAVNLAWRSFVIGNDLRIGNTSLNVVVPKYLQSGISHYVQLAPSVQVPTPQTRRWWWNGHNVEREKIGSLTQNALLFNFSSLNTPLQTWKISPDIHSRLLRYQSSSGFNLTFTNQISEVGEVATLYTNAVYNLRTVIEAPWGAVPSGDTLILESSAPWNIWLMLAVIIASTGLLASVVILERRLQRMPLTTRSRKSKR